MSWNNHSELKGKHSFLSPSKYHWLYYSDEKLIDVYRANRAKEMGTIWHDLVSRLIKLRKRQPRTNHTIDEFVNDAIGYKMRSEQPLYYSEHCFGVADAISFKNNKLRIHDLKTGKTPAKMEQLMIYAALFCLEYDVKPGEIEIELRIYQNDEIQVCKPSADEILPIMDKIIRSSKMLDSCDAEEESEWLLYLDY